MAIDLSNPELQTAWKELTQHNSKTNWILFSFEDNTNKLKLAAQGMYSNKHTNLFIRYQHN